MLLPSIPQPPVGSNLKTLLPCKNLNGIFNIYSCTKVLPLFFLHPKYSGLTGKWHHQTSDTFPPIHNLPSLHVSVPLPSNQSAAFVRLWLFPRYLHRSLALHRVFGSSVSRDGNRVALSPSFLPIGVPISPQPRSIRLLLLSSNACVT